jgi:hypothetical protein
MRLKEKVTIAYCMNVKNITKVQLFVPMILVCVTKKQCELMDENIEHMEEQLVWDGDDSITNMMGMYIKHPYKEFCDYHQSLLMAAYTADKASAAAEQEDNQNEEAKEKTTQLHHITMTCGSRLMNK